MMRLRVRIPEGLPATAVSCAWALRDATGNVIQTGNDRVGSLPHAQHIELIAPANRVLLTQTALPKRRRQRVPQMLRFAIENRITVEPERVHAALGPRITATTHAVAVVDREWIGQWVGAFNDAGRAPRTLLVETCLAALEAGAWTVIWQNAQSFVRTGPASGMALDAGSGAAPPAILQLALQEARQMQTAPERLVIRAEAHQLPDLESWSSALGVHCVSADSWDWKRAPNTAAIDLLQGEFAHPGRARELLPRLRPALIIGTLIVTLHVFGTVAHWALLSLEKSRLQTEMRALFRASFPTAQVAVDPPLQMHRQVDALRRAAGEPQRGDFLPLLAQAAAGMAGSARLRIKSVSYEQAKLLVDVELGSRSEAEALLQRVKARGTAAALDAVNPKGNGVEARFALSAPGDP